MNKILFIIKAIPKTIYFNFKAFPFMEAIKMKMVVSSKTKFGKIYKGKIVVKGKNRVFFGYAGSRNIISNKMSYISIGKDASITFEGKAFFGEGCSLRCDEGILKIGNNFSANKNCIFSCNYKMIISDDVLVGYNVFFRDSDGHKVFVDGKQSVSKKEIFIGNHCWICSFSDILKGVKISDGCIIAWKSCVLKSIEKENCLVGGHPAKIIKENVFWEK